MGSSTAAAASKADEIPEVPSGCEQEEQLLQALTSIPLISKALVRPGAGDRVDITVSRSIEACRTLRVCGLVAGLILALHVVCGISALTPLHLESPTQGLV